MKYGYSRCSTNELRQDIERQIRELMEQGIERENIYFEYASGLKEDRTELNKLLEKVTAGDTIISTDVNDNIRMYKKWNLYMYKNMHI